MTEFSAHKIPVAGGIVGSVLLSTEIKALPLVYINGGPGGTFLDEKHGIGALANERQVVLYDQLGSYHSPATMNVSLTPMPRFVDELISVLNYYGFEKAILLGHSFGGSIAIDFALAHPSRVAGLVLSSPLISTPRWIEDANALLKMMPEKERDLIRAALNGEEVDSAAYDAAEKMFYERHLCRVVPWPTRMLEGFGKGNSTLYNAMWGRSEFTCTGTLKDYDRFDDLKDLSMPSLLICGRYDEAAPETMKDAQSRMPNANLVVLENASHCPLYEDKDAYLFALRDFCKKMDA